MKKMNRLSLILIAAAMFSSMSVAGAMALQVSAEESDSVSTNYFKFHNGAAVRLIDDSMGEAIRFQSTIGQEYYENLLETNEGKEITLVSKITDADNANRTPFVETWELQDIVFNATTGLADFYHTIIFEDILNGGNEELIKLACALNLEAEMYIEVSDATTTSTLLPTNGVTSVVRSARAVANEAYELYKDKTEVDTNSGLTKAQRLEKYFGTRTEVTEDIYFEEGDTLKPVVAAGVADNFDFASAQVYGYKDAARGALPTAETFADTLGSKAAVNLTLIDKNNNILNVNAENAMYVTKALKTEADLAVFDIVDDDGDATTQADMVINGYYVLANNIITTTE